MVAELQLLRTDSPDPLAPAALGAFQPADPPEHPVTTPVVSVPPSYPESRLPQFHLLRSLILRPLPVRAPEPVSNGCVAREKARGGRKGTVHEGRAQHQPCMDDAPNPCGEDQARDDVTGSGTAANDEQGPPRARCSTRNSKTLVTV